MLARFELKTRFGHQDEAIELFREWDRDIGQKIGWTESKTRVLTGSVGACESTLVHEILIENLGELEAAWAQIPQYSMHADWGKKLGELVVPGSEKWEIFHILD